LVINERLLNCPPQLASPLHHGLFDEEVPWATEDEATQGLRDSFKFKSYLFMSRIYSDNLQEEPQQAASQQAAAKPRKRRRVSYLQSFAVL
jgi:protein BCP1